MNILQRISDARKNTRTYTFEETSFWLTQWRDIAENLILLMNAAKPILDEYEKEYQEAKAYAAIQIWASIQRNRGDPRWEYDGFGVDKLT